MLYQVQKLRLSARPQQKSHRKNAARPALDPNLSGGAHSLEDHLPNDGALFFCNEKTEHI